MIPVDSQTMREIAPYLSGELADRQAKIIAEVGEVLAQTLESFDITTRLRIAHFLGQTCLEFRRDLAQHKSSPAARNMRGEGTWATRSRAMAPGSRDAVCCN